jgi:2-polyprenyl-6-methoxyphenol hydroxylase-like FAD-dependent oxidoreductase
MRAPHHVPVLIVGAGPAGLAAAVSLARNGVASLLVERRPELSALPRATVLSTRSMEILRSWGLEEPVLAAAVDVEWVGWQSETLAAVRSGAPFPVGYPTREQSAVISPSAPACVAQDDLEPLLLAHLCSLGPARAALGTEVVDVAVDADGARAVLRDVRTGATRVVRAQYLVGADGAHSAVRRALGIPMRGPDRLAEAVSALFRAPLWELLGAHRHGIYFVSDPEGHGTFLPAGRGDRWLYGVPFEPGAERAEDYTDERFARLIRAGAGAPDLELRIERTGAFTFAAQLADRFRHGAAFLIGDAAHRVTPRGGTGLNTAFRDGHDLGWKLAWVLRGWAGPELLDSYEAERRPVAEHNVARSADPNGSVREAADELHADLGGRLAHVWLPSAGERVSTLDLLGPGLTLFTGPGNAAWAQAAAAVPGALPLDVRELSPLTARAMGIHGGGALLVRPDGTPAGWWPRAAHAATALRAAVGTALGGGPAAERDAA